MGSSSRAAGALLATVVVAGIAAGPASAGGGIPCNGKVSQYDYKVAVKGQSGGPTTFDGDFSSFSYVQFSSVHQAKLRVCEPLRAIRMRKDRSEQASATHTGEFLKSRDPQTGQEQRCRWEETLQPSGPLSVTGYDYGHLDGNFKPRWQFIANAGIGFDPDDLYRDAYHQVLLGGHQAACGENVPMVQTRGPDSERVGLLNYYVPDFVWPSVTVEGQGKDAPPRALVKLVKGKDAKLAADVTYENFPAGSYIEQGDWGMTVEFKRQGG